MDQYKRVRKVTEVQTPDVEATQPLAYSEQHYEERRVDDPAAPVDPVVERREVESVRADRPRRVVQNEYVEQRTTDPYLWRQATYGKIANVVWTIVGLIEALIGIRVILKLIGANAGNGFVNFIYNLSGVFVRPFLGIVNDPTSGNSVLEINSLIAMLVYLILGWAILKLIVLIFNVTEPPTA